MRKICYGLLMVAVALGCGFFFDSIPMMFFGAAALELGRQTRLLFGHSEVTSTPLPDIIPTYLQRDREDAEYREALTALKEDRGLSAKPIIDEDGEALPPVPGDVPERYIGPDYVGGTK